MMIKKDNEAARSSARPRLLFIVISIIFALILGSVILFFWSRGGEEPDSLIFHDPHGDYRLSFSTTQGWPVSDKHGKLTMMMDPFSFYRPFPGNTTASYAIDENGFRGDNHYDRPIIFVIGGSAAFGWGLPSDDSCFSALLEKSFGGSVEIINAGVPGFLSGQELSYLVHRLDPFHPVGYLIFDAWNDLGNQFNEDWLLRRWPNPEHPDMGFNIQFDTFQRRLHTYWAQAAGVKPHTESGPKPARDDRYFDLIAETYLSNIERMSDFALARGASVALCVQPEVGAKLTRTEKEKKIAAALQKGLHYLDHHTSERYLELTKRAEALCRKRNIPFIAAGQEDEIRRNPKTLYYDVVHLNTDGQQAVADLVLRKHLLNDVLGRVNANAKPVDVGRP